MYDPETVAENLKKIARDTSKILMKYFESSDLNVSTKETAADIVTQADTESDKYIRSEIQRLYPDAGLITEESENIEPKDKDNEYTFVADPLDGTTNFSCNFPHFAISIAMIDKNYKTIVGVIYDPVRDEMFSGIQGRGSYLESPRGKRQLKCRHQPELINCLLATGFNPLHIRSTDNNLKELNIILPKARCIRRTGSACLDLCYVAAARLDGYWELGPHIWDVAAGIVIVEEAGGIVRDYRDRPMNKSSLTQYMIGLIAAPPEVMEQLTPLIKEARKEIDFIPHF